ncbi:MAG: IS66 family transposase [Archangiaceae bacterium]|nr:IS66 family transposase [Archangiaceae bacterium]
MAELLAVAQRQQRKQPAPKPPMPPPVVEGDAKFAFDKRPKPPELPPKMKAKKQRPPPTGRKPLPAHLPVEEHALRPEACGHCGGTSLDAADEVVEEKLHVVKEHQRRRVVKRTTCRCRDCGERTTPRSLPAPYERSKVTCDWLAWLVASKFSMLTPLDRLRRDLKERGVPLAMGSLVSFIERAADLLAPIDGLHWQQLLKSSWMATDGTGLKVLVPKLPAAHDGYIELYRNRDCAVFQYEPDKGGERVTAKLKPFRGTLTADAEHRFNDVFASGSVIEAGCNAHGRRKLRDAEATQPTLARRRRRFRCRHVVEEARAQGPASGGPRSSHTGEPFIRPVAEQLERWCHVVAPTLLPSEPLMAAVRYYQRHSQALFRFIDDAQVHIDNSATEREFQNVAKLRLNVLFAGSTEGAHRACVLLGIIATCRAIGAPAQAYLTWAFERLGTHRDLFKLPLEGMTPAAYKKTLG